MSWDNFKLEEFACKHCGENKIEHELIDKLQALRTDCGFPFKITSGFRCADHPVEIKKSKPGTHALGLAADIGVRGKQALEIISKATDYGFTGIGGENFVYVFIILENRINHLIRPADDWVFAAA